MLTHKKYMDKLAERDMPLMVAYAIDMDGTYNPKHIYCYHCGTSVRDQLFCHKCGQRLDWSGHQDTGGRPVPHNPRPRVLPDDAGPDAELLQDSHAASFMPDKCTAARREIALAFGLPEHMLDDDDSYQRFEEINKAFGVQSVDADGNSIKRQVNTPMDGITFSE